MLIVNKGKIIDATIIEVPIQRNNRDENAQIKEGMPPEDWTDKMKAHKETDAPRTSKNDEDYFGYKNHIKMDGKKNFIDCYHVTQASMRDSIGVNKVHEKGYRNNPFN